MGVEISLKGKVALISGASRGIGEATALAFANAGANVVVASRKLPDLEQVAEKIKTKGVRSLAMAAHVAKVDESKNLVDTVLKEFGRIDILFNNAGTNPYAGPLIDAEEWAWDTTFNVNLKGPFFLAQLVARAMKEHGGGCMINTASVAGLRAGSGLPIYSITKAAYVMLTQLMAREWAPWNIRVNGIAPGLIKTRLSEALWKNIPGSQAAGEGSSLLRIGQPEDVADVVLFLASDLAKYITGVVVPVDAGQLIGLSTSRE
jgi:NAD(P)-dependent dehydrogenase (short-subunit alcohol dehydrogenase family)